MQRDPWAVGGRRERLSFGMSTRVPTKPVSNAVHAGYDGAAKRDDGIPLYTRYVRTPTKLYEVLNVERVLNCAPLVAPPRFGPPPRNPQLREHWVLNEDVYGNF